MNKTLPDYFSLDHFTMRSATDDDIARLVEIINEAYSYQDAAKGSSRTNAEHLKQRMSEVDFFVIRQQDRTIGCVYVESKDESLHFGLLTLIPEFRGEGIAACIVKSIEQLAVINGYKNIELDYMSLAPWLKKYYESYGFLETGEFQAWGSIDLVRMKKSL